MSKIIIIVASLLVFCACAQKQLVLNNTEMIALKQTDENQPRIRGGLIVEKFKDQRLRTDAAGVALTGLGNKETPIHLDIGVPDYLKRRFSNGLAKRGVDVAGEANFTLKGTINKFWVWEKMQGIKEFSNCEIDVDFEIVSTSTKKLRYKGNVNSYASGTDNAIDTTNSNGSVLETCMSSLVDKFLQYRDIQAIIEAG